ncbi:hypothetical protein AXX17_AT1G51950 [Arabidopsis thaliana]|uniref:Uncharacterized protein n=1 Tax=Arabidopsis thaliana TaxID=3702 RepID=A0A178W5V3_ARATH|nr:hypothetical protein AXX17_AT1G51950 [Arabidopsis thaliana]
MGGLTRYGVVKEDYLKVKVKHTSRVAVKEIKLIFIDTASHCAGFKNSEERAKFYARLKKA